MKRPGTRFAAFPRSSRVLHADSLVPGLATLILLKLVLVAWVLWLVLFQIPFYQISQSAEVTPEAMLVAAFPRDTIAQIQAGQEALFVPAAESGLPESHPLRARVVEVDHASGQVWLLLLADRAAQSGFYAGLPGQVHVVVQKRSPLSLVLQAIGMDVSA